MTDQPLDLAAFVRQRAADLEPPPRRRPHPIAAGQPAPGEPLCTSGKVLAFPDEASARAALAEIRAHPERGHVGRRPRVVENGVHHCKACHRWHLTATARRGRRADYDTRDRS